MTPYLSPPVRVFILFGSVLTLIALTTALFPTLAQERPLSADELTLKNAGVAHETSSLLDYFRRRTPTAEDQAKLRKYAQQLDSAVYAVRARATDELIRAGRSVLPTLRDISEHGNAETARRAQYCIQVIEQHTRPALIAVAARLLAERNPEGAAETLFAYLPFADLSTEEDVRHALKRIAYVDGKARPFFLAHRGLDSRRRAAAGWILGHSRDSEQRSAAVELLRDESAEVRFHAASALLASRESAAAPVLIALLSSGNPEIAWRAEDLLFRLAGENAPPVWLDLANDNNGGKVRDAWNAWWKTNHAKINWASLQFDEQILGFTLVCENQRADGSGRIYEVNATGQIRFQTPGTNPIDAQYLPGGRILVGDSRASTIYELDARGRIGWKHTGIAPTSVQRLPNGNTVVSTYQRILEITREGKTVFSYTTQGHTYQARKTAAGNYVWIDACGEITEIDATGKILAKIKTGQGLAWGSVERLRNGHYLVALGGVGKVQEIDREGKVYWEKFVNNPNRALRLANGNTLVASHGDSCVYEFDPQGNERWRHECTGRPFVALRR